MIRAIIYEVNNMKRRPFNQTLFQKLDQYKSLAVLRWPHSNFESDVPERLDQLWHFVHDSGKYDDESWIADELERILGEGFEEKMKVFEKEFNEKIERKLQ